MRVLILAGTTVSGKTGVSIPLAKKLNGEIINADSRQVYRELVIGTARPTLEQQQAVPHHFVGHLSIHDRWTSGDFGNAARDKIDEVISRDKTPLVVGGSMLYLRSLMDGFFDDDVVSDDAYQKLRAELNERGLAAMFAELQQNDPDLAARTYANDSERILRGLAVFRKSGKKLSSLQEQNTSGLCHPFKLYFLHGNREETYRRAEIRAREMVENGLVDEVRALAEAGWSPENCKALKTHGYQEVFPYLRGEISAEEMLANIQKAVRHYIKRQLTWFRGEPRAVWIERGFDEPDEVVADRIYENFIA